MSLHESIVPFGIRLGLPFFDKHKNFCDYQMKQKMLC